MTVRAQLRFGFGSLLLMTLATGTISIVTLRATASSKDVVARDFAEKLASVERLRYRAEQVVSTSRGYLLTGEPDYLDRYRQARLELSNRVADVRALVGEPESIYFADIERAGADYGAALDHAVDQRRISSNARNVMPYFEDVLKPARDAFEARLDGFARFERDSFERAFRDSRRSADRSGWLVGVTTAAGVSLGLWLALAVLRRLTQQFAREQSAVEAARCAAAAREEVLAVVSHDLRNPLGAILMGAALLERSWAPAEEKQRRHLESVRNAAQRMKHLIEDLLDVARIDAGALAVHREPCDVAQLVDEVGQMFELRAIEQSIRLSIRAGTPGRASIDRERLLQVFSNLVGNAFKFTPRGGEISVDVEHREGALRFSVSDTGPGIPNDQVPHLFERHWQSQRGRDSLGLGLYISRTIVELHGGRIWLQSRLGEGSTFHFTVPDALAVEPLEAPAPDSTPSTLH